MSWRRALAVASAAGVVLVARPGAAEWLVARHDTARTGAALTPGNIDKPAQYWRSFLGGALRGGGMLVGDTDGDGAVDVLHAAGGRLALVRPDGQILWQTENLGIQVVIDVLDLDGDGRLDVIARSVGEAMVVDGRNGTLRWRQPSGEMGTISATRIADFDGDGRPDLFLDRCGCCAVEGTSPGGELYAFPGGTITPIKLGPLPPRARCGVGASTVGDWNGDGIPDLLLPSGDALLLTTSTGSVLAQSAPLAPLIGAARCEAVNLDGQPGDEVVCLHSVTAAHQDGRRVFALAYRPGQTPALQVLWDERLGESADGELRAPGKLLWDLDGDGVLEIVVSTRQPGNTWNTHILHASTGATQLLLPGHLAHAVLEPGGAARTLVTATGTTLHGHRVQLGASPQALHRWERPARRVPSQTDRPLGRRSSFTDGPVLLTLQDGARAFLLETTDTPTRLETHRLDPIGLTHDATYTLDEGVGIAALAAIPHAPPLDPPARLVVSRNDGYVALLDGALTPQNLLREGNETLPGMRIGTYVTGDGGMFVFGRAPLAGRFIPGAPAESALVVDARGDLVRIDALTASNVSPARPNIRLPGGTGASLFRTSPGSPLSIAYLQQRRPATDPPTHLVSVVDHEGHPQLTASLDRAPAWDVLPGDLDADGLPDLAFMTVNAASEVHVHAMTLAGTARWIQPLTAQFGTSPLALADWNGDGATDVALAINTARIHDGRTGQLLAETPTGSFLAYFLPIPLHVTGDPRPELTLQGGLYPARTLAHDLATTHWQGPDDRPYPYGAIATCNGIPTLVEGSSIHPARLAVTPLAGPAIGGRRSLVLAGGSAFDSEAAATAAGATLGQLGDVAVSSRLHPTHGGPTALVGATDGHLYAVDPCATTLRWSHRFDAPVGAPILADTDGDGADDILVSVADGYLYGLRHEILPAPAWVWDVDPPKGLTDDDIDLIETESTLHAAWAPVPGATSYELAIVGAAGTYLTSPAWTDVGNVTAASTQHLPLEDGAKYYVGVRAIGPEGRGPDRPSDGVVVNFVKGASSVSGAGGGSSGVGGAGGDGTGGVGTGGRRDYDEVLLWGRACVCRFGVAPGASWGLWSLAALTGIAVGRRWSSARHSSSRRRHRDLRS
ncbi:FG-GAP repeat domain-containing protein [Chondromyces crocatus]|uniref:Fibronectin type-III domain-containing protein n=1 Tax=Chondromyces crocatus TaxID=52 RepID=A0A0K1E9J7_CHOCO|nr:VCBS repeat-containing protein [Chondromyces crocatus]AKT37545.1 uncharacterized protein CMC5_016860 [Chondromyces crocatus]